jgi:hypothetical protein
MLNLFRPSYKVVKAGWILKKFKHLQTKIVVVFGASLVPGFEENLSF